MVQPEFDDSSKLLADDLAIEIEDEYNPMLPNSYEKVVRERREEHDRIREEEVSALLKILLTNLKTDEVRDKLIT